MKKFLHWLYACPALLILMTNFVQANELTRFDLTRKIHESDLIIVGEVISTDSASLTEAMSVEYAVVAPKRIIKGDVRLTEIRVITSGPIAEFDPECCEVGISYMFFVEHSANSLYRSVNGRFGVYKLSADTIVGWYPNDTTKPIDIVTAQHEVFEIMNRK